MMMNKKKPFSLHLDVDSFMPATAEEKEVISRMRPSSTFFRDGVKRLLKNKVATISLILIVLITLSSIIIPMFWPYSYDQMLGQTKGRPMDNSYNNLAPFQYGKTELKKIDKGESVFPHIFGTDAHGRDYFIRVVYGTRISLAVGFFASNHRAGDWHDDWRSRRILRRQGGLVHHANRRYYLLIARYAGHHPAVGRAGAGAACGRHHLRENRLEHHQHVHRLWSALLGGHGAPDSRSDSVPP